MNWLRQLWQDAQQVLQGMSTTQRACIGMFVATVSMLLAFSVWLGTGGTKDPGMIPVAGDVDPSDYQTVLDQLKANGFKAEYDVKRRRVLVPLDQSEEAYLFLVSHNLIKEPHAYGFEEMLNKWSFSDSRGKTDEMKRYARENAMSRVIEKIDVVKEAQVVYSDNARSSLFTGPYPKSALVRVKTKIGKELTDDLAQSIIKLVANSKAGLSTRDVVVVDQTTGKNHLAEDESSPGSLARKKWDIQKQRDAEIRKPLEETIYRAVGLNLSAGGGVLVNVRHEVDANYSEEAVREILEGQANHVRQRKYDSSSIDKPAAEPGTKPNVLTARQMSDNIIGGRVSEQKSSEKDAEKWIENGRRERIIKYSPSVKDVTVSAVINLPYQLEYDDKGNPIPATSPDGRTLVDPDNGGTYWKRKTADFIPDERIQQIARAVARVARIADELIPEKIQILQVPWIAPVLPLQPPATDLEGMWAQAKQYFMPLLFLVLMLGFAAFLWSETRKHRPTQAAAEVEEQEITVALKPPISADEAEDAEMEATRIRVQDAVLEDPERAAALVRRWMSKDV